MYSGSVPDTRVGMTFGHEFTGVVEPLGTGVSNVQIERPDVTAVFGTSTPPAGLSGMLRRVAFNYSESSYLLWLPLMLADRIGIVEGFRGNGLARKVATR